MLLCNFNVNNLFVRYKFGKTFPGDQGGKSRVTSPNAGYLPLYLPRQVRVEAIEDDPDALPIDFQFERFKQVSSRNVASDHCAIFLKFAI